MRVPPSSPSVDMAPGVLSQNGFPKAGGQVTVSAHCYDGDDPMRTADGSLEIAIQLVRTSVTTGSSRAVRIDYRDERGQRSSLTIPFEITLCSLLDDVTPGCH